MATSFDEYATAFCSAWGTLFRVVGNPDTAGWTDGVHQLQAAAQARDDATAARLQGEINTELEAARGQIAFAAGWKPAARPMAELDHIFVAFEKPGPRPTSTSPRGCRTRPIRRRRSRPPAG